LFGGFFSIVLAVHAAAVKMEAAGVFETPVMIY
jgi:hypothetical protein